MKVRSKIALTVVATGFITAAAVVACVLYAFMRFEHESTFQRANGFLGRVSANYDDLLDQQQRRPEEFRAWLRGLVLYEPDTQLYLLDADGTVLVSTGEAKLPPGFKVALEPVRQAAEAAATGGEVAGMYVMGDDPERMDADAVVAARPLRRAMIRDDTGAGGWLYLVCHKSDLPASQWQALRKSFAWPALVLICGIVAVMTLLAALVIGAVTRPLRRLTGAVSALSARGLDEGLADAGGTAQDPQALLPPPTRDEFGQLTGAFSLMLQTLRRQWSTLRRLDHFRREGVSNLSHDLRSPLTATVACLETLEARWAHGAPPDAAEDRRLVGVALRNTRNAARLVQSLGDLAQLDEPQFKLTRAPIDVGELLDDIALRFSDRAGERGVRLAVEIPADEAAPAIASVDIELFERAVANLVDNALKFCPAGGSVTLSAALRGERLEVSVADTGAGIAADDLPHLFDRFYQSRQSVAPATGEGGKGLGLAIVKRIVELHAGSVQVDSAVGRGTRVVLALPVVEPVSGPSAP